MTAGLLPPGLPAEPPPGLPPGAAPGPVPGLPPGAATGSPAGPLPAAALAADFTEAMSQLVSRLAVVTTTRADGRPVGLLVSSLCSYSVRPPSLLVSIDRGSRSCPALTEGVRFGVHFLGAAQQPVAAAFASRAEDKFAGQAWTSDDGVPRLTDAPLFLHCRRSATLAHGDHVVLIGEVTRVEARDAAPLVHYRRRCDWDVLPAG